MALLGRHARSSGAATYDAVCCAHMSTDTFDAAKDLRTNRSPVASEQVEEGDGINLMSRDCQFFLPGIEQGHIFSRQDFLDHSSRPHYAHVSRYGLLCELAQDVISRHSEVLQICISGRSGLCILVDKPRNPSLRHTANKLNIPCKTQRRKETEN